MTDAPHPLSQEELDKIKAETDEIRVRTSLELARHDLNIRQSAAWAEKAEADAERAKISVEIEKDVRDTQRVQRDQIVRQEQINLASNLHHRLYEFVEVVDSRSVSSCISTLSYWHRAHPGEDIEIRFTSPGGEIISGFVLYDYIQELKRGGHNITTSTLGMAASMASILLQAGTVRVMGKEAWLVIHEGSLMIGGTAGEVEDATASMKRMRDRMLNIYAEGCARAGASATKRLTKAMIQKKWSRHDWYIDSDDALAFGFVDELR